MFTKLTFADANASYENAEFVIFGAPFDGTSCFRSGSRGAPLAIRKASYNFELYYPAYDIDLGDISFCDLGDIDVSTLVDETLAFIQSEMKRIIGDGKTPIMIGGEHSLTCACVRAFSDVNVVVLDAHLDLRDEYAGTRQSHACVSRRILDRVGVESYASLGIRSGAREEYDFAKQNGVRFYSATQVQSEGVVNITQDLIKYLGKGKIYLSIDMDVIDPAYAPAVGTPEPFGLTPDDIRYILQALAPRVVGFDLVEISPDYDHGQTSLLGAKLIREFIVVKGSVKNERTTTTG